MRVGKICYVFTIPISVKAFFIPQLQYLSDSGFDVTVVSSPDGELQQMLGGQIRFVPIPIPRGVAGLSMIRGIRRLEKFFRTEQFDMIQYSTPNAAFCASIAGRRAGVPIRNYHLMGLRYLGEQGLMREILKKIERYTCRLSTHIECVSRSNLKLSLQEKLFPEGKGVVLGDGSSGGVSLERFDVKKRRIYRKEIRSCYGIEEEEFVFGFVGRVTRDKGIHEIIRAFDGMSRCRLLMAGPLDEVSTLDPALYENSRKNNRIIYTDYVCQIEKYYAAMDVLLLPSYREGFGNVVIEAAAMGTPAIVSRIPGPTDTSMEGVTALWIEPGNAKELQSAMEELMEHRERMMQMQRECVRYAASHFEEGLVNQRILERKCMLLQEGKAEKSAPQGKKI